MEISFIMTASLSSRETGTPPPLLLLLSSHRPPAYDPVDMRADAPHLVPDGDPLRLWALSDLHVSHAENRDALENLPARPDDWLILAGDVTHGAQRLESCLARLTPKFRQVVWVPGNHELWTMPDAPPELRGVALYEHLVGIARNHGVLTPEDPYPVVELREVTLAPRGATVR